MRHWHFRHRIQRHLFCQICPSCRRYPTAPKIHVVTASVQIQRFSDSRRLRIPTIPENNRHGHSMPRFPHALIGIGKFCDANCTVVFNKTTVAIFNPSGDTILTGWYKTIPRIYIFHLHPKPIINPSHKASYEPASNK